MEERKLTEEAEYIFQELRRACLDTEESYFSVTSKSNTRKSCSQIANLCRLLREVKHSSGRKWPHLC